MYLFSRFNKIVLLPIPPAKPTILLETQLFCDRNNDRNRFLFNAPPTALTALMSLIFLPAHHGSSSTKRDIQ